MKSLDFMIIGAQKAGTTALSVFLDQHPEIQMAKGKEVHLFDAPDYDSNWSVERINRHYAGFFDDGAEGLKGEATPIYMYWPELITELCRYNPALRLIILLRDPVERAMSHYVMEFGRGTEDKTIWRALALETRRLGQGNKRALESASRLHSYLDRGNYARQLQNIRRHFPDNQILVIASERLRNHHQATLSRVFHFLGVDSSFRIQSEVVFSGGVVQQNRLLRLLLRVYFWLPNRRLKKTLADMGQNPDCSWL